MVKLCCSLSSMPARLTPHIIHSSEISDCICRASQWASHFNITNINKDLKEGEAYTYDLEWSPDAVKPPIQQKVRGVPPAYIE